MNSGLKNRIIKWGWITSRVPFLNKVSMKKNLLKSKGILISCNIDCVGIDNEIVIEPGCILRNCHLHIQGNHNKIHLAENVRASCMEIWIEDNTNTVTVGGETAFCGKIHIACTEGTTISIGNDCLFSQEIVIRSGDSIVQNPSRSGIMFG